MPNELHVNLFQAKAAVRYVRAELFIQASNRDDNIRPDSKTTEPELVRRFEARQTKNQYKGIDINVVREKATREVNAAAEERAIAAKVADLGRPLDPLELMDLLENVYAAPALQAAPQDLFINAQRITDRITRKYGIGNCGEMCAVALIYLEQRSARPIDSMAATPGNHAYLVIGRDATDSTAAPGPSTSWGKDAVVCDPWLKLAFPAEKFHALMPAQYNGEPTLKGRIA
jgi:hypothetical protein